MLKPTTYALLAVGLLAAIAMVMWRGVGVVAGTVAQGQEDRHSGFQTGSQRPPQGGGTPFLDRHVDFLAGSDQRGRSRWAHRRHPDPWPALGIVSGQCGRCPRAGKGHPIPGPTGSQGFAK